MSKKHLAALAALTGALAIPAAAQAHVTLQPKTSTAGGYTVENVRVPNEKDDASTKKVEVQFPDGFAGVSYQAIAGWTVEVKTKKLATPVQTDDGPITEGVDTITFTAKSDDDAIQPGQFRDFPLSLKMPDKPGTITFKALQTYSDGDVVRWIGAPDSEHPAPTVELTASTGDEHGAAPPPAASDADDSSNALGIAALIVAILGAGLAAAALVRTRRTTA